MLGDLDIYGEYCIDGRCDNYAGKVDIGQFMLGGFSLTSDSGKQAIVNLNVMTHDVSIVVDGQKIGLQGNEFTTQGDGSLCIDKDLGSGKLKITITPL